MRRLVLFELRHVAQWWPGSAWETNRNILCRHWPFPLVRALLIANANKSLGTDAPKVVYDVFFRLVPIRFGSEQHYVPKGYFPSKNSYIIGP